MAKRSSKSRNMNVYSNLARKRRTKKDATSRKKAEYLASLPKNPAKRFLYRLRPTRVYNYWFSKQGAIMALKIVGVAILLGFLMIGALFAYYRKDLDSINPGQLANRVKSSVTSYYDRNGVLLWQDKGDGNYKIVVDGKDISKYMKDATVSIEDKDFYKHGAISVTGIARAVLSNVSGSDNAQGGSTLTQQLVKQVFFADDHANRGIGGIPRKIKEMILSVEVERMYSKDDILNLYLNESPYGGPRNGVESAAKAYFGTDAKDLTLPEAALLAAIPNEPSVYNPYYTAGNSALIDRQHEVLNDMAKQGYITQKQADEAKSYPILDHVKPQASQTAGMKAPHFVMMVKQQLQKQLGAATVGQGGLKVTTTLDWNVQKELEKNVSNLFSGKLTGPNCGYYQNCSDFAGFSNAAAAIEDNKTGQVIALMGSRDFSYPGFGETNAATSFIQPGSSIKPFVYAQLFQKQPAGNLNFGSGSILTDVPTTFPDPPYTPQDDDGHYLGSISIRKSLDYSRNVPAVKAMAIAGKDATWNTIRNMGDTYYCTQGADKNAGLSSAIGGCGTRLVDHVNAYASLGRLGAYMPQSTVLKVTNGSGQVLEQYKAQQKQAIDPQAAYVVSDILSDSRMRGAGLGWGGQDYLPTLDALGVRTAVKTGTSNSDVNGQAVAKDVWTAGYTKSLSMAIWVGNNVPKPLLDANSQIPALVFDHAMADAMKYYVKEGKAKYSDWFTAPKGIKNIGGEVYPSYYDKSQNRSSDEVTFDKVSQRKATNCTPAAAQIQLAVTKIQDPYTKKYSTVAPDGYDASQDDNVHHCGDATPVVSIDSVGGGNVQFTISSSRPIRTIDVTIDGQKQSVAPHSDSSYTVHYSKAATGPKPSVSVSVLDNLYYAGSDSK